MKLTSVLVLATLFGSAESLQLRNKAGSRARQLTLAECEHAHKTTGQILAGCENFLQMKTTVAPPQQNMAQNKQAPPAAPKPMAAAATSAQPPMQGQALAATKQDPIVLPLDDIPFDTTIPDITLPDAAEAAVATVDAADAAEKAEDAAAAAAEALEADDVGECSEDFEKTLCEIIDVVDSDAELTAIFEIISKNSPCGVDVAHVLNKCVEEEIPLPENPEVFVPEIDDPEDLDTDEPELDVIKDLVDEEEVCVCEISEGDIETAEGLIEDSFTQPVDVEVDPDTGVTTVTDEATDEVLDKFPVDVIVDVIDVADQVEEAESDGEEVEPVVVIDNVQEILEEATEDKAEEGVPPNELPDEECCCGCCCCDCDHE